MNNKIFITAIDYGASHMLKRESPAPVNVEIIKINNKFYQSVLEVSDDLLSLLEGLIQLEQDKQC